MLSPSLPTVKTCWEAHRFCDISCWKKEKKKQQGKGVSSRTNFSLKFHFFHYLTLPSHSLPLLHFRSLWWGMQIIRVPCFPPELILHQLWVPPRNSMGIVSQEHPLQLNLNHTHRSSDQQFSEACTMLRRSLEHHLHLASQNKICVPSQRLTCPSDLWHL